MIDYIKQRIQAMQPKDSGLNEIQENEAIVECAHLIQELEEVTIDGSDINQRRDIDAVSISLDDDAELSSVEFSVVDGHLLDTPADILVHSESYEYMKGLDDFIKEAVDNMPRQFMEDDEDYESRIMEAASAEYEAYNQYIIQEGLFSGNTVSLADPSIQWSRNIDFGPSDPSKPDSAPFTIRLDVGYIPSNSAGTKILIKQRDSIAVIVDAHPEFGKKIAEALVDFMAKHNYQVPKGRTIWEIAVPKMLIVPVEPSDKFCVVVEFENVLSKTKNEDYIYLGFAIPVKASRGIKSIFDVKNGIGEMPKVELAPLRDVNLRAHSNIINKSAAIREAYREKTPIGRVVQETIDFGDNSTPPGGDATENADTSSIVGGNAATDIPAAEDDTTGDAATTEPAPSGEVESKDLSNQIADEVEKQEAEKNDAADGIADDTGDGINTPATDLPEDQINDNPDVDLSGIDTPTDAGSIDSELDALNNMGNQQDTTDVNGITDGQALDDLSPNEIKQAVVDKVNKMPISQIKAFLSNDEDTTDALGGEAADASGVPTDEPATEGDAVTTEAFVLTKKNINAELDVSLRRCLGDLNDQKKSLDEILNAFKKDGKKLNRALSKASKMADLYNDAERDKFIKLNKCTADLIVSFSASKMDVKVTKRLIKAFTSSSVIVGKIVEKHKNGESDNSPKRVVD